MRTATEFYWHSTGTVENSLSFISNFEYVLKRCLVTFLIKSGTNKNGPIGFLLLFCRLITTELWPALLTSPRSCRQAVTSVKNSVSFISNFVCVGWLQISEMDLKTIFSSRGKVLLLLDNYKFYKTRKLQTTGEQCWRCVKKTCMKIVWTLGESDLIFSRTDREHNHEPLTEIVLIRSTVCNSVKRKLQENSCEGPSKLVRRELDENLAQILTKKDIKNITNNISRAKTSKARLLLKTSKVLYSYPLELFLYIVLLLTLLIPPSFPVFL